MNIDMVTDRDTDFGEHTSEYLQAKDNFFEVINIEYRTLVNIFYPTSNIMSDSTLFSQISDIPISSSVRYRLLLNISGWMITFAFFKVHK
jgi:hypothetical protein